MIASLAMIIQAVSFGADELEHSFVFRRLRWRGLPVGAFFARGLCASACLAIRSSCINRRRTTRGHFGSLEFITPVLFDTGVFLVVVRMLRWLNWRDRRETCGVSESAHDPARGPDCGRAVWCSRVSDDETRPDQGDLGTFIIGGAANLFIMSAG